MINADVRIAVFTVVAYFVLALGVLPPAEYLRALGVGAAVFTGVSLIAVWQGPGPINGMNLLLIAFSAGAILVMPTLPAMGGTSRAAIPIGFLGMQVATLLWSSLRWRSIRRRPSKFSAREAWKAGLAMATVLSAIATLPIVAMTMSRDSPGPALLLIYVGYYVGFLSAATIYWLLQRMTHLATGRYLVGVLGGFCVYLAVWPVVALTKHEPLFQLQALGMAFIAGGLVGPAVALGMSDDLAGV